MRSVPQLFDESLESPQLEPWPNRHVKLERWLHAIERATTPESVAPVIAAGLHVVLGLETCVLVVFDASRQAVGMFAFDALAPCDDDSELGPPAPSLHPIEVESLTAPHWLLPLAGKATQRSTPIHTQHGPADAIMRVGDSGSPAGILYAWYHGANPEATSALDADRAHQLLQAGAGRLQQLLTAADPQSLDQPVEVTPYPQPAAESKRATQAEALLDLSLALGTSIDPTELVQLATEALRHATRADVTTTYVFEYGRSAATTPYWAGATPQEAALLHNDAMLPSADVPIESKLARSLKPEIVDDLHTAFQTLVVGFVQLQLDRGVQHLLAAPVIASGKMIGVTYAWNRTAERRFDAEDVEATEALLNQLAAGLQRAELFSQERRDRERVELLLESAHVLNRATDGESVRTEIIATLGRLFPNDVADIVIFDEWQLETTARSYNGSQAHSAIIPTLKADLTSTSDTVLHVVAADLSGEPRRWLAAAIRAANCLKGMLLVSSGSPLFGAAGDQHVLGLLAAQAAGALTRAEAFSDLTDYVRDLTLLQHFGQEVTAHTTLNEAFAFAGRELTRFAEFTAGGVALVDSDGEHLLPAARWGASEGMSSGTRIPIAASLSGAVFTTREPVLLDDAQADPRAYAADRAPWRSMICAPLVAAGGAFGVLILGHERAAHFTTRHLRLVSLIAEHLAAAIVLIRQNEHSRNLYRAGIEALAAAVDAKDTFTHLHSRRVAELSRRIALKLGLGHEAAEEVELAGLLHDVGKIGIPDHILTKPGRLDPEERLIMMSHASISARIVAQHGALAPLMPLVRHHHEWHDGRGYPDGLRGDAIPLGAAIIAAADAYETMTSDRVYRAKLARGDALSEMLRNRGTQFHPDVVDALVEVTNDPQRPHEPLVQTPPINPEPGAFAPIQSSDVVGLRVLTRIAEEIGRLTELGSFLDHVRVIVRDQLGCDAALIWLIDPSGALTLVGLNRGTVEQELAAMPPDLALLEQNTASQHVLRPLRGTSELRYQRLRAPARSAALVPLVVEDRPIGYLEVTSREPERFRNAEHQLLQAIASQVAPTVRIAQLHDVVKRAADTDGLTGVLNHRAFYRELDGALAQAGEADQLYVLIIDVVGLKAVNDTHGHVAGDLALRSIAAALRARLRERDVLARYGGDEFAAIVQNLTDDEVEALVARIEQPIVVRLDDGQQLDVRLRCGHASLTDSERRATELVARADSLLYRLTGPTTRQEARIRLRDSPVGES